MTYEEYCEKVNELVNEKDVLYTIASRKMGQGDKAGAAAIYALIDETQAVLDSLVNPNDTGLLAESEGLLFS